VPITELVAELDVGLITVRHLTKDNRRPAIYRGQASIGIGGAARAVFVFGKDPGDRSGVRRCVAAVKFNIGKEPPTVAYRIVSEHGAPAHIRWEKGTVPLNADELLAGGGASDGDEIDDYALEDACAVLRTILKDGPVESKDVYRQAREAGIKRMTLERAKAKLGARSVRDGTGERGQQAWRWHPRKSRPRSSSADTQHHDDLDDVDEQGAPRPSSSSNGSPDLDDLGAFSGSGRPRSSSSSRSSTPGVSDDDDLGLENDPELPW
jgi:hypothetical protein